MKRRKFPRRPVLFILVFLALSVLIVLSARLLVHRPALSVCGRREAMMGTVVTVTLYAPQSSARAHIDAAFARMKQLESLLDVYSPTSELSRINEQAAKRAVPVSRDTLVLAKESLRMAELTHGAFDPTVRPLIQLWQTSAKQNMLPAGQQLRNARAQVDYRKVVLDEKLLTVKLLPPIRSVDLGGIAKGYAAEQACRLLQAQGVKNALVDAGGDIFALGSKPDDKPWTIGVQDPFGEYNLITTLRVSNHAVVTSGNYRRFFQIQGKRYSHIIDPRTGSPADLLPSVTVIAPHGAQADALATGVSVLGVEEGFELIESLPDTECLIVAGEGESFRLIRSSGFAAYEIPTR